MWRNKNCCVPCIIGSLLPADPTTDDMNYPPGFMGWTADGKVYFHIGSGQWINLTGGGGGGGGVESLNGLTGALNITADPPLKVTPSGKNLKLTFEDTYIKTINGINPDSNKNFVIDKTDPITITDGVSKVTVGSTGGGGGSGIQRIKIDDVTLEPEADGTLNLVGDLPQGIQVIQDGS